MSAQTAAGPAAAVVLAGGRSKRFGGTTAKVLHPVCGRPLVSHVLEAMRELHKRTKLARVCVVVPPGKAVERAIDPRAYPFPVVFAVQRRPLGTGDAVRVGLRSLPGAKEVLVCAGDAPLVRATSLAALVRARRRTRADGAILTAVLDDGGPYGRVLRRDGEVTGVVEARDASPDELRIAEINTCTYVFARDALERALPKIRANNAQKEIYFTDVVGRIASEGGRLAAVEGDPEEVLGANTRAELATVSGLMRWRVLEALMDGGVTMTDPDTTYVDAGVHCGADTVLEPNTHLRGATRIGRACVIGPNTLLADTTVGDQATVTFAVAHEAKIGPRARVGPFATLRPGTVLGRGAEMGSFGEMKNAKIGDGVKVHHFSYLGDVKVGRGANIGAGTITCNYDGKTKHDTVIGDEAFIGSDSILVAPVRVGRGAYTGAGSVVTQDVRAGELVYGVPATRRKRSRKPAPKRPVGKGKRKRGRAR